MIVHHLLLLCLKVQSLSQPEFEAFLFSPFVIHLSLYLSISLSTSFPFSQARALFFSCHALSFLLSFMFSVLSLPSSPCSNDGYNLHTSVHTHTHTTTRARACENTRACDSTHTHTHTYTHTIRTHTRTHSHTTRTHAHTRMHTHARAHTRTYTSG